MNTRCLLITAVVGASVLTAWGPPAAFGQCEITPVTASDGFADQKFGWSTAISGDYAVVGTDEKDNGTGAAYVYERDGLSWTAPKIERLLPTPELDNDDGYGRAVAISGRVAVVGARKHDGGGAVYVFRRNLGIWEYQQELTADDGAEGDLFGSSVAIDGDWIVVGAPEHDVFGVENSGAAYAFHFDGSTWTQARKFRADDHDEADQFGIAVAISGNWVVVGSKWDDDGCPGEQDDLAKSGSAYTFFHDPAAASNVGWELRTKLQAQIVEGATVSCDAGFSDNFGIAVAISGDRLVVGAIFDDDDGSSSGSAYVYRLEEPDWVIEQKLTASDGAALDNFGRSVSILDDLVLVGASRGDLDDPVTADTGSAYLYRRAGTEWIDELELTASDAAGGDRFGQFVSIGGDYAAIGAYRKNESTGAAYIFAVGTESDCDENGVHDDCDVLANPSLDDNNNGTIDSCECTTDDDCVGALKCISGTCDQDSNLCVFTVDPGFCAIAGECPGEGALNPDNTCQVCDSALNDSEWSVHDDGFACDDGDSCTSDDICTSSVCGGSAVDCSSLNDACNVGVCNPGTGVCEASPINEGLSCDDDQFCTTEETCSAGVCGGGSPTDCSGVGDQCETGVCNETTDACEAQPVPDGGACNDGQFCTTGETCFSGVCGGGSATDCSGAGDQCNTGVCSETMDACVPQPANEGLGCDDGDLCTSGDVCTDGVCGGSAIDCSGPGDQCNIGVCDETTGACEVLPTDEGLACNDEKFCTTGEICSAGSCAVNSVPNGADVWIDYEPTCTGTATIDTCGSTFDTVLELFNGCSCAPLGSLLGCNDDENGECGGTLQSSLSFPVTAGQCIKVRISGISGDEGTGTLNIGISICSADGEMFASDPQGANLGTLDPATGLFTVIGPFTGAAAQITEIEWAPDGSTLYASTGGGASTLHTVDPTTGTILTGVVHDFGAMMGMEFDSAGNLLSTLALGPGGANPSSLVTVDPTTGVTTVIGLTGYNAIGGLAFDAGFTTLFGITSGGAAVPPTLLDVNPATGAAVAIATVSVAVEMSSLEFTSGGQLVAGGADGILYEIDTVTGAATAVGPLVNANKVSGLSVKPGVGIPSEPTDDCSTPPSVNEGTFSFTNVGANTDGPPGACGGATDCSAAADQCNTGVCNETTDACEPQAVFDGTACDEQFCTTDETCTAGVCGGGALTDCSSLDDPCNIGICDDTTGACEKQAANEGVSCDDSVFCNGPETCQEGLCTSNDEPCTAIGLICDATAEQNDVCSCDPAVEGACDDGNECTIDECDAGTCNHVAVPDFPVTACTDNGLFCDGVEICNAGECISPENPCDAGEACDERGDRCLECEIGADCDDGDDCTTDRCPGGICVHEMLPECEDDDNDGVLNANDQCPDTPEDAEVDAIGCTCPGDAIDTDHDGVFDCNDGCADTPLNESAISGGCSCSQLTDDSDGDGVADKCDDCASTPSGESVDDNGCGQSQIDSDRDGVMNDADDCAGTASGIDVGDDGCPVPVDNGNDNDNGANDNDNGNDNGTDNTNDNAGDNVNDNEPGQDVPGDEPAPRLCGLFGMINLVFLGLGMVAMRMTRRRHRRSRR